MYYLKLVILIGIPLLLHGATTETDKINTTLRAPSPVPRLHGHGHTSIPVEQQQPDNLPWEVKKGIAEEITTTTEDNSVPFENKTGEVTHFKTLMDDLIKTLEKHRRDLEEALQRILDNPTNNFETDEWPNYNFNELPLQHELSTKSTNDDDSEVVDYPKTNQPETTDSNTLAQLLSFPDHKELENSTDSLETATEEFKFNDTISNSSRPAPFPGDHERGPVSLPILEPLSDVVPKGTTEGNKGSNLKKAYVLLLGVSGAEKSSTLNFLFGNRDIAKIKTSDSTSAKQMINEYVFSPTDNPDTELHIIDTPGLGSSNEADYDDRLVSSLRNYLHNHADLNGTIPNMVLIFSRFDENRMDSNKSRFVSMLRGYQFLKEQFTTSDDQPSNIVYVLTRFLNEIRFVKKRPEQKLGIFKDIIEKHTSFPKPIVITVADNSVINEEDIDMDEDGNYKLPNKEWYPQNIINKMVGSCKNRSDSLCESILESVFRERSTIPYRLIEQQITPSVQPIEENTTLYPETKLVTPLPQLSLSPFETPVVQDYIKNLRENCNRQIQAVKSLCNATLDYAPPPTQPPPLERPEVLIYIKHLREGFTQQIERLTKELAESTEMFNNFTQKAMEENQKERETVLDKLPKEAEEAKTLVAFSCYYSEPELKGTKLCSAEMESCTNIHINPVKSVNTYNSCVKFHKGMGCTDSGVEHKSNAEDNTKFPLDIPDGEYFSVIRCEFAS